MFERHHTYPAAMTASSAGDRNAIPLALRWALETTKQVGGVPLLYVPGKTNAEGNDQVVALAKRLPLKTWRTLRTFGEPWGGGVAVALWPNQEHLGDIADHHATRAGGGALV